jgi:hypothetical protein
MTFRNVGQSIFSQVFDNEGVDRVPFCRIGYGARDFNILESPAPVTPPIEIYELKASKRDPGSVADN